MANEKRNGQKIAEKESKSKKAALPVLSEREHKYDPNAKIPDLIADLRRVQNENEDKYITRNFYRSNGSYSDSSWDRVFGTFNEFRRQAGLDLHRGARRVELHTGTHAARDRYRGFQETELDPYIGKYERPDNKSSYKRLAIASDFHGKQCDEFSMRVFIDTLKRFRPDVVCLAGDIFDNYVFSRFDKDPRSCDLEGELKFVREKIFKPIREAVGPNCQIDLVVGNHDQHLLRHVADRSPYLKVFMSLMGITLAKMWGLDEYEINLVSKADLSAHQPKEHRAEMLKNYKVYEGLFVVDHFGGQSFNLCGASGHSHKPDLKFSVDERTGSKFWMTLPCMSKVDADYVQGLNKYQNGFGLVHIDKEKGACAAELVVINDSFCVVGGKVYYKEDMC